MTPLLTATPDNPPTYNPSMAETFSWVPIQDAGRPLYAQAVFIAGTQADVPASAASVQTIVQGSKTVALSGTPETLTASQVLVDSVEILANKDRTTANTGVIWVGVLAGDDTQLRPINPGNSYSMVATQGKKIDLQTIYIDVQRNGDGAIYTALT